MAVGHFDKMFDLGIDGLRLADDSVTRLRNEYAENDPIVFLTYVPYSNDDTKGLTEVCSLDTFLLRNMDVRDKVVIIADTRHFQRLSERKIDPMLCKGDLAFFCNCPTTLEHSRLWAHERTLGIPRNVDDLERIEFADVLGAINEDQHLTRCTPVCFTSTEEDQAEQSDQETIDEVLGEQDMEEGRNFLEEADREKLIYLNRRLFPVTESQRKNVWHPGSVYLAEFASQSDGYIVTCDIYLDKYLCRCFERMRRRQRRQKDFAQILQLVM